MEQLISNNLQFTIEFLKLILFVFYFTDIKRKKSLTWGYIGSIVVISIFSIWYNISEVSIIFFMISIIVLTLCSTGENRIKIGILSYIIVSIFDILSSLLFITIFHFDMRMLEENHLIAMAVNSISLFLLFVLYMSRRQYKKIEIHLQDELISLYIVAGIAITVYLTALQFIWMGENYLSNTKSVTMAFGLCTVVLIVICIKLNHLQYKTNKIKIENYYVEKNAKLQNDYYLMMLKKENETKAFRHDFKEHLACIQLLFKEKKYEELEKYLEQMEGRLLEISPSYNTGNDYINAVITDLSKQYPDVQLSWKGKIPKINMSYADICTIFYNLLINSFKAASESDEKNVYVKVKLYDFNMLFEIKNNYKKIQKDKSGEFLSTKEGDRHGYGINNIKACVSKYQGNYKVNMTENLFLTEIILPNIVEN